jgi:hypothetical protein
VRVLREVKDPAAHKADLVGAGLLSVAVASLAAAIVEGSTGAGPAPPSSGAFAVAVVAAGSGRALGRHPNPIIEPAVIRHRAVALADLSSLVFFAGFGAMVLGGVLFLTGVWHESILRAGFMIAPGPLLAGLCAFPGRAARRALQPSGRGHGGQLLFAGRGLWWITRIGLTPDYVGRLPARQPRSPASGSGSCCPHSAGRPRRRSPRSASPPAPPSTPCAARSGWPSGCPAWWPSSAPPPVPRGARLPPRLDLHGGCSLAAGLILQGIGAR